MKQSCFDKKIPHSYMASGKFQVCANCGKKRGPKKVWPHQPHPPAWAEAWKKPSEGEA